MTKRTIRLFLFEDNPDDVIILTELLNQSADTLYKIHSAESLNEGIQYLQSNEVDIVITDLGLIDSMGIDTFLKIREISSDAPIVILSGLDDKVMALKAVELGAQDYIVKSGLDGDRLERTVYYAIERHRMQVELSETKIRELQEEAFNTLQILPDFSFLCASMPPVARDRLADASPGVYTEFVNSFVLCLDAQIHDPTTHAHDSQLHAIDAFTNELYSAQVTAYDLFDVHKEALYRKMQNADSLQLPAYVEEATNLLVAVLSRLLMYYRAKACGDTGSDNEEN